MCARESFRQRPVISSSDTPLSRPSDVPQGLQEVAEVFLGWQVPARRDGVWARIPWVRWMTGSVGGQGVLIVL